MGTPGPARVLTSLCASLSPVLRPPACNVLGLQETRGKKNLGALDTAWILNQSILREINPEYSLERLKLKLQ